MEFTILMYHNMTPSAGIPIIKMFIVCLWHDIKIDTLNWVR